MKNFYTKTLLIAIFLLCSNPINAYIKVDGICYNTEENSKTAEVTDGGYNYYKGEINIPSSIIYQGTTYKVTKIGKDAFRGCDITSVTIQQRNRNRGLGVLLLLQPYKHRNTQ